MVFEFRHARRVAETVLIGLVGPSGAGKTYSALLLATGMCAPAGRVVVIDTEGSHGRALQYAPPGDNTFDFDHLKLTPPYKAERYQQAFEAAEKRAGQGGVVIIDSMSAEHESEGGALDEHHQRSEGKDSKNMIAWANIRPHQHALCRALTNSRCHVICCFRAEDKIRVQKVVEDGREKTKPVPIGWQAIGWKRWPYEMQVCVLLSHDRKGVPIVDGFDWGKIPINMRGIIPTDQPLTAEVGKRLAAWAAGGSKAPDSSAAPSDSPDDLAAARRLYKAIGATTTLGDLGMLEHENADLLARLKDEKAKKSVADLFNKRLAELTAPTANPSTVTDEDRAAVASGDHFRGLGDDEAQDGLDV